MVAPLSALNFAPIAVGTTFSTSAGTPVSGALPASDPDGSPLSFSIVANGTKGSAAITNAATGAFTYTPNAGATGADSFSFKASDGALEFEYRDRDDHDRCAQCASVASGAAIATCV